MASESGRRQPAFWLYVPDTGGDAGGAGVALRIDPGYAALAARLDDLDRTADWLKQAMADPDLPACARPGLEHFSFKDMGFQACPVDDDGDDLETYARERGSALSCTGEPFDCSAVQALLPDEGEEIARLHPDDVAADGQCFLDVCGEEPMLVFDVPAAGDGGEYGWHRAAVSLQELRMALQQPLARMRAAGGMEEALLADVRKDGMALKDVPDGMKTPGLCLDAVRSDGNALQFVPEKLRTPDVCGTALETEWRHAAKAVGQDENEQINWVLESGIVEEIPDAVLPGALEQFRRWTGVDLDIEPVDGGRPHF